MTPQCGTAETLRHAERLRFHRDHVRIARRFHNSQRHSFGNRHHQHCAVLVRNPGNRRHIFDRPEEVW